jgi:hemin uptake protein HemP
MTVTESTDRHPARSAPSKPDPIDSRALFGGGRALKIHHAGTDYTLRITRLNKLILTK